jgi:hypothetical protein
VLEAVRSSQLHYRRTKAVGRGILIRRRPEANPRPLSFQTDFYILPRLLVVQNLSSSLSDLEIPHRIRPIAAMPERIIVVGAGRERPRIALTCTNNDQCPD